MPDRPESHNLNDIPYYLGDSSVPLPGDVSPAVIPTDKLPEYFEAANRDVFDRFRHLGDVAALKVDEYRAPNGTAGGFYKHRGEFVSERETLSVNLKKWKSPRAMRLHNQDLGTEDISLVIIDGYNQVSFHFMSDGRTVFTNDQEETGQVLDTPKSLVERTPGRHMPVGNPATWLVKLTTQNVLAKMETDLAQMPDKN